MDNKLLLTNSIVLLYRESQFADPVDNSADLVKQVIDYVKLPETSIGIDSDKSIVSALKKTALAMSLNPPSHKYELSELLLRIRVNCDDDDRLYDGLSEGITTELNEAALRRICLNLRQQLRNYLDYQKVAEITWRAAQKLRFEQDKIPDLRVFTAEVCAALEPYQTNNDYEDPSVVDEIDFSNLESVQAMYSDLKEQETGQKIIKLGWQGLNRMLQGGIRRGEAILLSALQHNYKTGFGLSIFKHTALYNDAQDLLNDKTKKPLLLRLSFEDPAKNNMQFLYQSLYENETLKMVPDYNELDPKEVTSYVVERMKINGWEIMIKRVDPTNWTYRDIQNLILKLEAEGYEIIMCQLDYLALVPTTGCMQGPHGVDKRDLLRRTRNFMSRRDITLFTPHQMSTEAKQLVRDGRADTLVQEVAGKGYYEGSRQLDQEVDLELHIHIVKVNGRSYLCVQRGKHRVIKQTPEKDLYCVLPFDPIGGIRDDIHGADTTLKKPGGGPIGSTEENPWWSMEAA
jgi:hypothetical protein